MQGTNETHWFAGTVPIVLAPMAGGPGTVALAGAVAAAGALAFVPGGYITADQLGRDLDGVRVAAPGRPVGVNLFVPGEVPASDERPRAVGAYARELEDDAVALAAALGDPRWEDDAWEAKLDVVRRSRPDVVSFTFGCPPSSVLAELRELGVATWVTVTSPDEAARAMQLGAGGLVVQGLEAGGHRGSFVDDDSHEAFGLLPLLALVRGRVPAGTVIVAAGGLADGASVAAALAAGATAAQLGTAFLRCPEAGTSAAHRTALDWNAGTCTTRAFSGRTARTIRNAFVDAHDATAPAAYPEVHHLTFPLRAAGRAAGDPHVVNLWAGQAHPVANRCGESAADLVRRLAADARLALAAAAARC